MDDQPKPAIDDPRTLPVGAGELPRPPGTASNAPGSSSDPLAFDQPLMSWMCGAKGKRTGKPCRAPAMVNGRCYLHGGKSLAGIASPAFKHGRYSKNLAASLPPRFRERFEAAMADPELLSLRAYVGVLDARILDAVEKFTASDSGDYRQRLLSSWEKLEKANAKKVDAADALGREEKAARVGDALNEIGKTIRDGAADDAAWQAVSEAIRDRAALTLQESKRRADLQQNLTIEQAMGLVVALHGAVTKFIKDPKLLTQIGNEIHQATGLQDRLIDCPSIAAADADCDP